MADIRDIRTYRRRTAAKAARPPLALLSAALVAGLAGGTFFSLDAERRIDLLDGSADVAAGIVAVAAQVIEPAHPRFGLCAKGRRADCVIDGDTFVMAGDTIRIADIDAPETHPPRCEAEARLGEAATLRLHALLNEGPVDLEPVDRDRDRYGRALRIVRRDGMSIGERLVAEGLARPWIGRRMPWCA